MQRRYELCLTPAEAIEQLEASKGASQLLHGTLEALGHRVVGSVHGRNSQVVLCGRLARTTIAREPLSAYMTLELSPTERGTSFTLAPASGIWTTREFVPAVTFGSVVVMCLAALCWPVALVVAAIYVVAISLSWLMDRRYVLAARKTLIDVVWRAWSGALVSQEQSGYRAMSSCSDEPWGVAHALRAS